MKTAYFILIGLCFFLFSYSQNYDLVITTKGDSIACFIDSITDSHIHLEMKVRHQWINTSMSRNEVTEYKYKALDKKLVLFKPGSSYIEKAYTSNIEKENTEIHDVARHAIHCDAGTVFFVAFTSINYELTLKQNPGKSILRFRTGYIYSFDSYSYGVPLGLTALFGKKKGYFELTTGIVPRILGGDAEEEKFGIGGYLYYKYSIYPLIDFGYRYEPGKENLFYRFVIGWTGLGVGVGYAF